MRILTTIILALLLTACVTTQAPPQDNGYLPMPEEFLGECADVRRFICHVIAYSLL